LPPKNNDAIRYSASKPLPTLPGHSPANLIKTELARQIVFDLLLAARMAIYCQYASLDLNGDAK